MRYIILVLALLGAMLPQPAMAQFQHSAAQTVTASSQTVTYSTTSGSIQQGPVIVTVTGTFSGTLQPKSSVDGSTFSNASVLNLNTLTLQSAITTPGQYLFASASCAAAEVVSNGWSSGVANVTISGGLSGGIVLNVPLSGSSAVSSQNLTQVGGASIALGQTTMANSLPVTVASNQTLSTVLTAGSSTVGAVTQASGPWSQNITQIGGSAIALGQTTMSASVPVTLPSDGRLSGATKSTTSIWSSTTLTAGAGNTTSSTLNITTDYADGVVISLTNGATGPTVAAQVQVNVSPDGTTWYNLGGALVGSTANSGVANFAVDIPAWAMYVQLVAGSNTVQNVTVSASLLRETKL